MELNKSGAAQIQVDGRDGEIYVHEMGISAEIYWEEGAEEWHLLSQDKASVSSLLSKMGQEVSSQDMESLGFLRVEREII
jgi:hypothetical protein